MKKKIGFSEGDERIELIVMREREYYRKKKSTIKNKVLTCFVNARKFAGEY